MSRALRFVRRTSLATALAIAALPAAAGAASATTYTVTTTADTTSGSCVPGACSLRQAITAAQDGDTIIVPAGTYVLSNGQLVLSAGATIDGAGQGSTVLQGGGSDRVMLINGNSSPVVLRDLTITGGDTIKTGGGGIAAGNGGGVTLDDVTVSGNQDNPPAGACATAGGTCFNQGGGGIFSGQNLVLNDSTVSDNSVDVALSNGDSGGGGILIEQVNANLTLNDSTVAGNTATVNADVGGPTNTDNNGGGGIYNDGLDLAITDSTVSANTVTVDGAVQSEPADGGGGVYQFGNNMRLDDSTISDNVAHGPGVDKGGGGGVFDDGNTSQYLNSTIANNSTDEPSSSSPVSPDTDGGGGVLLDSVFGGAVMANMTITGNSASAAAGGGINNNLDSEIEITDSIVAGNTASSGAGGNCDSQPASGNGIISEGYNLTDDVAGENTCSFGGTGDIVGANPDLGSLTDNGGPTHTEALRAGSPAIGAGDPSGCTDLVGDPLATDQRGVARPQPPGGRCDIGAYERALPVVSTSNEAVTGTTVLFGAMVSNPDPRAGTVHFEYGPTTSYGSMTSSQALPGNSGSQTFIGSASRLAPGTYHFRVVATNPDGTTRGPDATFTIAAPPSQTPPPSSRPTPVAPAATAGEPTHVGPYTATLNGTVNPEGEATSVEFQYGTTTRFASHTAAHSAGSGTSANAISAAVTGLLPSHTYHVRVAASSSAGKTVSSGLSFKTGAPRKPLSFAVKVKPRVASKSPFMFHVKGRLGLPVGLSPAVGCKGKISLRAIVRKTVVGAARGKVGRRCGYALKVTLKSRHLPSHGSASLVVVFGGNPVLRASKSRPVLVRFGAS